jgi:copper chaperone
VKKIINIEGMACNHCVMAVKNALSKLSEVKEVKVDLSNKTAIVEGESLSDEILVEVIEEAGYDVISIDEDGDIK